MTTTPSTTAASTADDVRSPRSMAEAAIADAIMTQQQQARQKERRDGNRKRDRSDSLNGILNENSRENDADGTRNNAGGEDAGGMMGGDYRPGTGDDGGLAVDSGSDDRFVPLFGGIARTDYEYDGHLGAAGEVEELASPNALETGRGVTSAAMLISTAKRRRRGGLDGDDDGLEGEDGSGPMGTRGDPSSSTMQEAERRLEEAWKGHLSTGSSIGVDAGTESPTSTTTATTSNNNTNDQLVAALSKTETILLSEIESVIQTGIQAFHDRDAAQRELGTVKDLAESRQKEISRLTESERQSRETITNLLRAVETAKSDARSSSRHIQVETRLRGELTTLRTERDAALANAAESKRRATLAEEEVRTARARLTRLQQEKNRIERDSRAALSLAKSLDSHSTSDAGYYKRQIADLNERINVANATIQEQKIEMAGLRRQRERTLSQNQLSQIRAAGGGGGKKSGGRR